MQRLDITGASNFYYYGKPTDEVPKTPYPLGQEITTHFPANVAKIRLIAIFAFTAFVGLNFARLFAAARIASFGKGYLATFIPATFLAAYTAYKHLLTKDPLVEAFYKIAGGENEYNNLPEIKLDPNKKTSQTLGNQLGWNTLEHPVYRLTTTDGRKGMVIKGLSHPKEKTIFPDGLPPVVLPPVQTQAIFIFIEKLDSYDIPRRISNVSEWAFDALVGFDIKCWRNPFSESLRSSSGYSEKNGSYSTKCRMKASISTDRANEFIAQRGVINKLEPRIVQVQ